MNDPVYQKLKADAGIVLADLWRALRHQHPVEEWRHPRHSETVPPQTPAEPSSSPTSGLCYFHLN